MNFDYFLNLIVSILNCDSDAISDEKLLSLVTDLHNSYASYDSELFFKELYNYIDKDFELYSLILSAVYHYLSDNNAIYAIENILYNEDIDIFVADSILSQLRYIKFTDMTVIDSYKQNRLVGNKYLTKVKDMCLPSYPYTPYNERVKKRIVIATDQLLDIKHAPTRIVLNVCSFLIQEYGYDVYLLVNLTNSNPTRISQFWYNPAISNYQKEINGMFRLEYNNTMIRGFQFEWSKDSISDISAACELIYLWKPLCVYYIGGSAYRHDIYKYYTTLISMPCTDGYSVSEAQVLASYMHSNSPYVQESVQYIKDANQHTEDVNLLGCLRPENNVVFKKSDYNIPDNSFLICIMGNRLDQEMSVDFISMLEGLMYKYTNIYIAFVGDCIKTFFTDDLLDRIRFLGYQTEVIDVMKMMDLFVNPPRKGGGSGALFALQAEVPIASLANNDVANVINNRNCCNTLEGLKELIVQFMTDDDFYSSEVELCKNWKSKMSKHNDSKEYAALISTVDNLLSIGVIQ